MTTFDRFQGQAARPAIDFSEPKPLLRGWSHVLAAVASVLFAVAMLARAESSAARTGALVFGLSMVLLYSVSAVYHRYHWEGRNFRLLTAVDHANIFVMIAGTFTPFGLSVLSGRYATTMLTLIWVLAALGICGSVVAVHLPRWATVAQYVGLGWAAGSTLPPIGAVLPREAMVLLLAGGIIYSFGGMVYALKRPDPLPHVFGFHEIFHLLVVVGNGLTGAVVWFWVL